MDRRRTLGLVSAVLLITGAVLLFVTNAKGDGSALGGPCIKVGLVLFAVWLAYPDIRRIPTWMFVSCLVGLVVVVWRWQLIVIVLPTLIAFWMLRPRPGKSAGDRRR